MPLTEDPPSQTCTCRSRENYVTAGGLKEPRPFLFWMFCMAELKMSALIYELVTWRIGTSKPVTTSLWVPNIVQKMSAVPWKVGIVLEMVWFSSYKLLNIYKQAGPGKRESGNWMGSLWSWEYWRCFLWHKAVHRSLGCEHNAVILHCRGNCVHTPLRSAALLMLIQEVSLDSLLHGDTVDLCFLCLSKSVSSTWFLLVYNLCGCVCVLF